MDTTAWIIVAIAVAVAVVVIAAMRFAASRRTTSLRDRFGPEYDHAVSETGSRRGAERELQERERRYESLDVRPLPEESRARFSEAWERAERTFVDDPELAAREADRIVRDVLAERGYPDDDLETQTAAVSVDHPRAVQHYRHGHDLVQGNSRSENGDRKRDKDGKGSESGADRTEALRQAMVDFRAAFTEMVEPDREPVAG